MSMHEQVVVTGAMPRRVRTLSRGAWVLVAAVAVTVMSGCLAAAAGGAGYVVGHEVADDD
jgi:hypothetical protein